ncbi:hypothetical protein LIER_23521 [Lithospermum erythrorhizon]|uniref:Uncharacterized protein n=1 Tax=Lithospermum erythrorhizon TaxID=34254 RepID=A0AAV3QZD0_LITER
MSPPGTSLPPRKRMGFPLTSSRPSQFLKRSERAPPFSSSTASNHAEFFSLQGVALQSYKELLSSYEEVGGSSSQAGRLEGELKALKKEKTREEGLESRAGGPEGREGLCAEGESNLRAGQDEMLQTHDHLLNQLTKSQRHAQIMEATLEGTRTTEGLGELVRSSNVGHDLLFQHFTQALERTIQAM